METKDSTPRYLPSAFLTPTGISRVASVKIYPPHQHPAALPVRPDLTAVVATLVNGRDRCFGFDAAWINSELRCVVQGFGARDEVRRAWQECKTL